MGRKGKQAVTRRPARPVVRRRPATVEPGGEVGGLFGGLLLHHETSPRLTGGDVDADWTQAHLSGEEAVGGSVATPDQDVVDELGRALGVEQDADAEVPDLDAVLRDRDRRRWQYEEEAALEEWR